MRFALGSKGIVLVSKTGDALVNVIVGRVHVTIFVLDKHYYIF